MDWIAAAECWPDHKSCNWINTTFNCLNSFPLEKSNFLCRSKAELLWEKLYFRPGRGRKVQSLVTVLVSFCFIYLLKTSHCKPLNRPSESIVIDIGPHQECSHIETPTLPSNWHFSPFTLAKTDSSKVRFQILYLYRRGRIRFSDAS
jgi:hypothetical protein